MVTGERLTITMTGGAPWGFRLQGGGSFPLEVAKIRKKSHASDADLREGDTVVSINGVQLAGKTHQSAMGLVDVASNQITMEVIRSKSAASRPLDPQRQPRIIPVVEGQEKTGPGLVSKATANYSTTEGNTRRDIHTDEYVINAENGRRITKTVTEEKITRFQNNLSPSQAQGSLSPAKSQSSLSRLSPSTSQTSVISGEHVSRSPNRSPVMWKPPSLSPASDRSNTLQEKPKSSVSYQPNINISVQSTSVSSAPIAKPSMLKQSVKFDKEPVKPAKKESKENIDPIIMSEQAKWEARQGPASVPKFKLENFGCNTFPRSAERRKQSIERVDDPRYPMFEVYKPSWKPPVEAPPPEPKLPPVAPRALSPAPPPLQFSDQSVLVQHHPGMIKPPAQNYEYLQLEPPPPPPPMPPAQGPPPTAPKPKRFRPGLASTPKDEETEHHHPPDHLPVFAPRVYFAPEDDSGFPGSPTRSDPYPVGDDHSDASSVGAISRKKTLFGLSLLR